MKLIHRSTIKNFDGTIDIDITIANKLPFKNYSYSLSSEFAARKFHEMYRRGYHGKALTILNQFKIKPEEEVSRV